MFRRMGTAGWWGSIPTPFFNTAWTSSGYSHRRTQGFRHGRGPAGTEGVYLAGMTAPMPEDEPQFGSLWEHVAAERERDC
jgi:hypothetical protein